MKLGKLWIALAALAIAACSGDGCGCTEPTPGGFPSGERVDNGVQIRVTQDAFDSLVADPVGLVDSLLGSDNGAFNVPATCGGDTEICCDANGMPKPVCGPVNIDLNRVGNEAERMEINVTNGNGHLQVVIRARIKTASDLDISADTGFGRANCDVGIDSTNSGNESITISVDLDLVNNGTTNTVEILNADAVVSDIDNDDVSLSGGFVCGAADLFLKGTIVGMLRDELESTIEELLGDSLCKSCPSGDVADCGEFADACDNEVCMRGGACLQELGLAGRVAGAAFSGFSSGQTGNMDIYEVAGGYAETAGGGISMGMLSGMLPAGVERDRCAPMGTKPADVSIPRSSFFTGDTRPDNGNPFGVGIGIHKQNLDLFSWAAHDSGLLCLNVGPEAVDLLNTDTFSILMPSLVQLAHDDVAPVLLGLRPQVQPAFTLGAGTVDGNGDIDDPLITVDFPQLEIDFFALVDYQWVRVMTMAADVTLPINLEVDADGALSPVIGDIENAFQNITVTNSEALTESPEDLAASFPVLLDLAVPLLADGLSIDLPALGALTLSIQPDGITSIEQNSILAIFGDLAVAPPASARVHTTAQVVSVDLPERSYFAAPQRFERRPAVTLELGGTSELDGDIEYSTRIDGGLWSPYSSERRRTLTSRLFALQGRHKVEVRARVVGEPGTTDRSPAVVEVPIDTAGPHVSVSYGFAGQLWVSARDYVDDGAVSLEYKLPGEAWQTAGLAAQGGPVAIDIGDARPADVLIRAVDRGGNATEGNPIVGFHGAGGAEGCSCDSGGGNAGGFMLILICALLLWRRPRRQKTTATTTLIAVLAIGVSGLTSACNCGGDDFQPGEAERGPTGRWLSMAGDDNRVVLAGYEEEFGDLVIADVADDGTLEFRAADGVPNVDPVHDPKTYRNGVLDPGPNVGAWTSIALIDGRAVVAHQDLDNFELRFAYESGDAFSSHSVDGSGAERAGFHNSLAIRDGVPTIAYQVIGALNADGQVLSQLRFARGSSELPGAAGDWTIEVVDETPISCAGLCLDGGACVEDADLGEVCKSITDDCTDACGEDQECVAGTCEDVIAPPASYDVNPGTGLFAHQATLNDGRAAIVYYNAESGDLMAAVDDGGSWTITPLDAAPETDTGAHLAAINDPSGLIHVAYLDAIGDRLLYLTFDGATASAPSVIDDGVRDGEVKTHPVGAGASIMVVGGEVVVTYQDGLLSDLMVARGTAGAFAIEPLRSGATLDGFYTNAVVGAGATWVGAYSYDRAAGGRPGGIFLTNLP